MITVAEAGRLLAAELPAPEPAEVPVPEARGLVLAEDVRSDIDMPPFPKALMDGYAVISSDALELEVLEEIHAGRPPTREVRPGTCSKIMTGAPMPAGADAVQQVEKTERLGNRVRLLERTKPSQNVAAAGQDIRKGDVVLRAGDELRAAALGVLAAVGRTTVRVLRRPSVALLVTGDELVDPGEPLRPGAIRNSNAFSLLAQLAEAGVPGRYLGIARDREDDLRSRIREGLKSDVLIVAGGVSAGDRDLVVPCLEAEGVRHRLHRVAIKPGRPFFFGTLGRRRVFGLPGNPVSTFVTFEVFVRPFLARMCGLPGLRKRTTARLLSPARKADREQYLPARLDSRGAELLPWQGSADLFTVARANGLAIVPAGASLGPGDNVDVMELA